MNSTGKILFGSFLAISVVLMFLIFSMQKSAQLKLDIEDIQHVATQKDTAIQSIKEELESAKTVVKRAKAKNKLIPTLKNNLKTTEQEKLVYIQQLDDFQAELQTKIDIANNRLAEISQLQKQQEEQQQLLSTSNDKIASAAQQNAELAATLETTKQNLVTALHATQQETTTRELELKEYTETLAQKDRVVQIYKEKLDKAGEDMMLLQVKDANETLNLKLILDELAVKTATVKQLTNQLNWANNPDAQAQLLPNQESPRDSSNTADQALIIKLSLENDNRGLEIQDQKTLIIELQSKLAATSELVTSYASEIEQLRLTNSAKDNDIRVLQNKIRSTEQNITQLKRDFDGRANELQEAKTQTNAIAKPLTDKITALELQISQAATQYTQLANSLSQAQTALATAQNDKQILTDELNSLKTASSNAETQLGTLRATLDSKETALMLEEDIRLSLAGRIDPLTQALTESEDKYTSLNNNFTELQKQLQCEAESKAELSTNFEFLLAEVKEQDTTIQNLEKQLQCEAESKTELSANFEFLLTEVKEQDTTIKDLKELNIKHQERISHLIEEVSAAKAVEDISAGEEQANAKQPEATDSEAIGSGATELKAVDSEATDSEVDNMTEEEPMEIKVIKDEAPETLDDVMEKVQEEAVEDTEQPATEEKTATEKQESSGESVQ